MPLYTISSNAPIPDSKKAELARLIMNVHCGLTGAPETFVNVIFSQGVPLPENANYHILAGVRKGRTGDMNAQLRSEIASQCAELLETPVTKLKLDMAEMPAAWIMEGGNILPEPGEEDQCEWLQNTQH